MNIDKLFLIDVVLAISQARQLYGINVKATFIGAIESDIVFDILTRSAGLLEIDNLIEFTKASVLLEEMDEEIRKGYFLNFTVGDAFGYSSIESLTLGYKTLFYNIDRKNGHGIPICQNCSFGDFNSLLNALKIIHKDSETFDRLLEEENEEILASVKLNRIESELLKSLFV